MSAGRVRRPTEQAAVGRVMRAPERQWSMTAAFDGLALSERHGDLHGALLCRRRLQRTMRDGQVGE